MTDNLYETYIANQASLTSFEKTALKVLVQNEVSNSSAKAFKITPPVSNNSGYSFGPLQFDLKNSSNATTFTGALTASGLFSEGEADAFATRLAGKKGYANSNLLSDSEKAKINQALSSEEGKAFLIERSIEKVRDRINNVNDVIADARADIQPLFQNDTLKLALIDYDNRFNLRPLYKPDGTMNPDAKMAQFLANGQTTLQEKTVQFIPDEPWASIERFQLATKEAAKIEFGPNGEVYSGAGSIQKRLDGIRTEAIRENLSGTEFLRPLDQPTGVRESALPSSRWDQDTGIRIGTEDALWPAPGSDTANNSVVTATALHRQRDVEPSALNTNDTDASETLSVSRRLRDEADVLIAADDYWRNPEKQARVRTIFQTITPPTAPDSDALAPTPINGFPMLPNSDAEDLTMLPSTLESLPNGQDAFDDARVIEAGDPAPNLLAEADELMAADDYWRSRAKQARVAAIFKQLYPGTVRAAPLDFGEGI